MVIPMSERWDPERCSECGFHVDQCRCAELRRESFHGIEGRLEQPVPEIERDQERIETQPTVEEISSMPEQEIEELLQQEQDLIQQHEQEIGGGIDHLEDAESVPDSEILTTSGLLSMVRDEQEETMGHIYMTEWDDVETVLPSLAAAERKPGISILLRSSPGSYHLYNLSVRPINEQIRDVAAGSGDLGHVRWAARRGYFVLRLLPKYREETGKIYKQQPEILRVFDSPSEFDQSAPHLDLFEDLAQQQGAEDALETLQAAREQHETVGVGISVDHYQTVTDHAKRRFDTA